MMFFDHKKIIKSTNKQETTEQLRRFMCKAQEREIH